RHGLEHATRSGGHSFAGHSSTQGVVIDVSPMCPISVDGEVATVGAGARLGDVYDALDEHDLAIPAGTCPPVGIAGFTLGGGLGILGRKHGVLSDRLIRAEIVLADGRVVEADEHHHEDLFWALRGAGGGNFGVVTSLELRMVPAPTVTNFHLTWAYTNAAAVIDAWQRWAPNAPNELAASLKITDAGDPHRPQSVDVYGALSKGEADAPSVVDGLIALVGFDPSSAVSTEMDFADTRRFWANLGSDEAAVDQHAAPPEEPYLFAKSEFFARPLPADAVAALLETFASERRSGQSRELDFMPWGGAYNAVPPDATAFVHREELFQLKHAAVVVDPSASTAEKEASHRQVVRSWGSVHPFGSGRVFQNFADPELESWADAYYGGNLARLIAVKARYDQENFFRFDQSLPTRG
ncbi:MAG TPA: FAD-binding oxidoreductase, partial [Actinomycetota bacterium]|nr:FAD-binding oxidoreductase [Actinomycetota bacterium]